jgi:hypothetical protein
MTDSDFTELDLPRVINTSNVDFVEEFYNPLPSCSIALLFYRIQAWSRVLPN